MTRADLRTRRAIVGGLLTVAVLLTTRALSAAEAPADPRLDPAQLNEVVDESMTRIDEKGARWTAITNVKQKGEIRVEVVQFGGRRKLAAMIRLAGEDIQILQVIERDGSWCVEEQEGIFGKYRPYEAPFFLSTAYLFLERAELAFAPPDLDSLGTLEQVADGAAVFRTPLADEAKAFLQETVSQAEALAQQRPLPPELQAKLESTKDLLEHGVAIELDLSTGILVKYGTPDVSTRIEGFTWLDSVPDGTFSLDEEYPDFASDPTVANLDECVMIGHFGGWQPSMREGGDTDARLLNLETGELRRIPFVGSISFPGCFLRDRERVVVSGVMTGYLGFGLYEIDLSTGENRKLGGAALDEGFCFDPCVSPDGTLIAVKRLAGSDITLPSHIYVVDVESGEARKIGEVVGGLHLSWMPDGKRILMMREEFTDWDKPCERTICTMALDGTVEDICPGEWPVLIGGNRIMFTPRGERVWHTCNLDGSDVKILADGLRDYGFPTVSPDGMRLLMMRFGTDRGPRPTIIKIGESEGRDATPLGGLWAWPVWQ